MPYELKKKSNGKYVVKKKDGKGKTVAGNKTDLTKERAMAAMRARYANEGKKKK